MDLNWEQMTYKHLPIVSSIGNTVHTKQYFETDECLFQKFYIFPLGCKVLTLEIERNFYLNMFHSQKQRQIQKTETVSFLLNPENEHSIVVGYALSHPISHKEIPPLNIVIPSLHDYPNLMFLHDIAILEGYRGQGAAKRYVDYLYKLCLQMPHISGISLVSAYNTEPIWEKLRFKTQQKIGYGTYMVKDVVEK